MLIASWAVMKTSGTAAAPASSRAAGNRDDVPLVHDDAFGEAAAADDPEHPVADLEPASGLAARDHGAGDLDSGDVLAASRAERDSGPPAAPDRRR